MLSIDAILQKYANINYEHTPIQVTVEKLQSQHTDNKRQNLGLKQHLLKHNQQKQNVKTRHKKRKHRKTNQNRVTVPSQIATKPTNSTPNRKRNRKRTQKQNAYIPKLSKLPKKVPIKMSHPDIYNKRKSEINNMLSKITDKKIRKNLEKNNTIKYTSHAPPQILRDIYKSLVVGNIRIK